MAPPASPPGDCRCLCGSLLARLSEAGVELKCRRCKRILLVALPPRAGGRPLVTRPLERLPVREIG